MSTFFGNTDISPTAGTGWQVEIDDAPVMVGFIFQVNEANATCAGVRIFLHSGMASSAQTDDIWGFLYEFTDDTLGTTTLKASKQIATPHPAGWNDITFDTPVAMIQSRKYAAYVYMPNSQFVWHYDMYDIPFVSPNDSDLVAPSTTQVTALNADAGNGVYSYGTIIPTSPPANPARNHFKSASYGVDALVNTSGGAGSAPANTVAPHITTDGTPQTGETVTCSQGTWTGDPTITYAYQWKRDTGSGFANISGAVASSRSLQVADEGAALKCTVTATNSIGSTPQDSDNTISPAAPAAGAPVNTSSPVVTGNPEAGQVLSCTQGSWTNSPTSYSYQWKRGGVNISGAAAPTYTVQSSDVGLSIKCTVTATNASGSVGSDSNAITGISAVTTQVSLVQQSILLNGEWVRVAQEGSGGGGGSGLATLLVSQTVDTGSTFKLIMLSDGTVRAIPVSTPAPGTVSGLAVAFRLSSVRLSWNAASTASYYTIFRNGVQIATTTSLFYRDTAVGSGLTYTYRVQTVDQYGQRSPLSGPIVAFVDPAVNAAPVIDIRVWPTGVPTGGTAIVRVNAFDVDIHNLAFQLNVSAGQLAPTDDPSVWTLSSL